MACKRERKPENIEIGFRLGRIFEENHIGPEKACWLMDISKRQYQRIITGDCELSLLKAKALHDDRYFRLDLNYLVSGEVTNAAVMISSLNTVLDKLPSDEERLLFINRVYSRLVEYMSEMKLKK